MKKKIFILTCFISLTCSIFAFNTTIYSTGYFTLIVPEDYTEIEATARFLNKVQEEFFKIFHFNYNVEQKSQIIRIFSSKDNFDDYILARTQKQLRNYSVLKYSQKNSFEIVFYLEDKNFSYFGLSVNNIIKSLFIQYLNATIIDPPLWIQEGFLVYFENLTLDTKTNSLYLKPIEQSQWLTHAKKIRQEQQYSISEILNVQIIKDTSSNFISQAWALVSFFLDPNNTLYNRILHESLVLLEEKNHQNQQTKEENTRFVYERFDSLVDLKQVEIDFSIWLENKKTVQERIQMGVLAYNSGDYKNAEKELHKALELKQDPLIFYYLGLSSFSQNDYLQAEEYYNLSLEHGGETSTIHWALALNAYADKRYQEAQDFAQKTQELSPEKYKDSVKKLLSAIPQE